jgi:hypothetical protein
MPDGLEYKYGVIPIILPNGINIGTAWNCGASGTAIGFANFNINSDIDDVAFLTNLLDTIIGQYNVDTDSIFFSGSSLGGFMANRMGIECGNRINAIASVNGTIGASVTASPTAHINELHFHGTEDQVIDYYTGGLNPGISGFQLATIGSSAEDLRDYWKNFNLTNEVIIDTFPDIQNDGKLFIRHYYNNGITHHNANLNCNTRTAFVKVIDGTHDWWTENANTDIDYFTEMVKFFRGQWFDEPTIFVPAKNAQNVPVNSPVSVTFINPITADANFNDIDIYPPINFSSQIAVNQLIIGHTGNLEYNTTYTVTIPAHALQNLPYPIQWSFTTENSSPPPPPVPINPVLYFPNFDETDVAINSHVYVVFDTIITQYVEFQNIKIEPSINIIPQIINDTLHIRPTTDFDYNTEYTVTIPIDALQNLETQVTWSFTTVDETVYIKEIVNADAQFAIFPNPAKNEIRIVVPEDTQPTEYQFQIIDLLGKIHSSVIIKNSSIININNLQSGVYFVRIGKFTRKLIVE